MPASGVRRLAGAREVPDAVVEAYPKAKLGTNVATPSMDGPGVYRDGKGAWDYHPKTPPTPATKRKTA